MELLHISTYEQTVEDLEVWLTNQSRQYMSEIKSIIGPGTASAAKQHAIAWNKIDGGLCLPDGVTRPQCVNERAQRAYAKL